MIKNFKLGNIQTVISEDLKKVVNNIHREVKESDLEDKKDFSDLPVFIIDIDNTRDFEDTINIKETKRR